MVFPFIRLVVLIGFSYLAAQNVNEWPNLYNSDFSSFSPTTVLKPPLKLKWVTRVFEPFKSGPVVAEGKLVCQGRMGSLYCLDAETGELLWRTANLDHGKSNIIYSPGSRVGACISNGRVYSLTYRNGFPEKSGMHCYDLNTGRLLWRMPSGYVYGTRISPFVIGNKLFCISVRELTGKTSSPFLYQTHVQAWDAVTGDLLWSYPMDDTISASASRLLPNMLCGMAATSDRVFASSCRIGNKGKTVALDFDGKLIWQDTTNYITDLGTSGFAVNQGKIYVCNDAGVVILNCADGAVVRKDLSNGYQVPAFMNNRYWRRTYGSSPIGYNVSTGVKELTCAYGQSTTGCGNASAANGYLYLGHGNGRIMLRAYDAISGAVTWEFRMNSNVCTAPAIAYDKLYVTSGGSGDLVYCFENAQ